MITREVNEQKIKKADILVGIPSYKEAENIAYPVQQIDKGLRKYFPDFKSVILNCDNNSPDRTEEVFLGTKTETPRIYMTTPAEIKGKGYNFENMFRKAYHMKAKVVICVDADLKSITPEWVKYFTEAILEGYDYATPVYARHKYDGTITNNICYPLVYGVLGSNIRQPIGGDFALKINLVEYLIKQAWYKGAEEFGIDIFLTMNAILGGFKIVQVGLGSKKHKPSAPNLGSMFLQVVSSAFFMIIKNIDFCKNVKNITNCALLGIKDLSPPQDLEIDRESIIDRAVEGYEHSGHNIRRFIDPGLFKKIDRIFKSEDFVLLDSDLWSKIVYNMISAFQEAKAEKERDNIVESLRGIYFARFVSFIEETWRLSNQEAEDKIKKQAQVFFNNRNFLLNKLSL